MRLNVDVHKLFGFSESQGVCHLELNVSAKDFVDLFISALEARNNDEFIFLTCSVLNLADQPDETDIFLMLGKRDDLLDPEFLKYFKERYGWREPVSESVCMMRFLEEGAKVDGGRYPLFLEFNRNTATPDIYVSYRFVAPDYREKGIMKKLSLALLKKIQEMHPDLSFYIKAYAIHPATYLFFNPAEKELKFFDPLRGHRANQLLETLLKAHEPKTSSVIGVGLFTPKKQLGTYCGLKRGFLNAMAVPLYH
ncbi:MAG: hypothetical protein NTU49_08505 [Gammaproteobacteria bacterium]|nr:hypothetical protein [Gammaproteobacteria bacterium]